MKRLLSLVATLFLGTTTASMAEVQPYAQAEIHPEIFKYVKQYERRVRALEMEARDKIRRGDHRELDALVDLRRLVNASLKLTWTVANPFSTYPRLGEELKETRRLSDRAKKSLKKTSANGVSEYVAQSQAALVKLETAYQHRIQKQQQRALASQ